MSVFAVVVFACVNLGALHTCDVLSSPIQYVSQGRCQGQGAILAGMYKSHFGSAAQLEYKIACVPVEGDVSPEIIAQTAEALSAPAAPAE